ncbi:MAG: GNAT family N-acetyltransferase [Blastocatellia bacterium]|nr:GNAT family N-acetyltransferase [Blastocatellia bacterium]
MKIEIVMGPAAKTLVGDAEFRQQWKTLYDGCSWGSVYQSEEFVLTWYATYKSHYLPVIVTGTTSEGALVGLFTLAIESESGNLVFAGGKQAEYQAWLADARHGDEFIESALDRLSEALPGKALTLLFMLPTVPVQWAESGVRWSDRCHVRSMPRGLLEVGNGDSFKDTLRKKKQSKINRLKRLGNLHLDRIQEPEEVGAVLEELLCYQTLRLRAIYNLPDVQRDPLQREFYTKLARFPRMIHATALRVNDELASAQIHIYNREQVLLGLITHSPFFARYSPGELHILMTAVELAREEVPVFDLTPGGQYKDRYATHHDEVHIITIFFKRADCVRYKLQRNLAERAKAAALKFKITPEQTRDGVSSLQDERRKWARMSPASLALQPARMVKRRLWHQEELQMYATETASLRDLPDSQPMAKNQVADLLLYEPRFPWQPTVNQFLRQALEKIENGQHVYTRVENDRLVEYGWLSEPQSRKPVAGEESLPAPAPDAVVLSDLFSESNGPTLPTASLSQLLRDAAQVSGATQVQIEVSTRNSCLRNALEKAGFQYQYSVFAKCAFGKTTRWSNLPAQSVEPQTTGENAN